MNRRHTLIADDLFAHPPCNLDQRLDSAGCLNKHTYIIIQRLYAYVDLNKQAKVMTLDEGDTCLDIYAYAGDTCEVAVPTLTRHGKLMCDRQAAYALAELKEAGIISARKGRNANSYHIHIYDQLIAEYKEAPDKPKLRKLLALEVSAAKLDAHQKSAIDPAEDASYQDLNKEAPSLSSSEPDPVTRQPENRGEGKKNSQKEKRADPLSENSSSPPNQPSTQPPRTEQHTPPRRNPSAEQPRSKDSSSAADLDTVPNRWLQSATDRLANEKSMNTAQTDRPASLEAYLQAFNEAFKPDAGGVIVNGKQHEDLQELDRHLEKSIAQKGLEIPPLIFFKRCIEETQTRVANDTLKSPPISIRFYLDTPSGSAILSECLKQRQAGKTAADDIAKTKAYLDDLKAKRKPSTEEEQAKIRSIIDEALSNPNQRKDRTDSETQ